MFLAYPGLQISKIFSGASTMVRPPTSLNMVIVKLSPLKILDLTVDVHPNYYVFDCF